MGHRVNQLQTVVRQTSSGYRSLKACWQPRDWLLWGKKSQESFFSRDGWETECKASGV